MMQDIPFINRKEAIALFNLLIAKKTQQPQMLSPIITYVAPPGGGKSTLFAHLQQRHSPFPYATLDFTRPEAPRDMLSILFDVRSQLTRYRGRNEKPLTFPRFDLGMVCLSARSSHDGTRFLSLQDMQKKVEEFISLFHRFGDIGDSVGNISLDPIFGYMPFIAYALRQAETIPALQQVIQQVKNGTTWNWYRDYLQLGEQANIKQLLQSLLDIDPAVRLDRSRMVEYLLPAALLEDLRDALREETSAVVYLDGFEALTSELGIALLEALAVHPYQNTQLVSQPLLVVVASSQRLYEVAHRMVTGALVSDNESELERAEGIYRSWQEQLSKMETLQHLDWRHLYLEFWLSDFTVSDIEDYVNKLNMRTQRVQLDPFMAPMMHRVTHGHPRFLAAIIGETYARGHMLTTQEFEQFVDTHQLIDRFLERLTEQQHIDLTLCAVPRTVDVGTLQVVLDLKREVEAQQRLNRYRRLAIFQPLGNQSRFLLHPVVRMLLLRQLSRQDEESDYYRTHTLLRQYYQKRATAGNKDAQVEEVYHALALGDAELAIKLAIFAQKHNAPLWKQLLAAVGEAPGLLITADVQQRALRLAADTSTQDASIEAIVLTTWQLSQLSQEDEQRASALHQLGKAYNHLAGHTEDQARQQEYIEQAIDLYHAALKIFDHNRHADWAATYYDLGIAYLSFASSKSFLQDARKAFRTAQQVYTRKDYPREWEETDRRIDDINDRLDGVQRNVGDSQPFLPNLQQVSGILSPLPIQSPTHSGPAPKQWKRRIIALMLVVAVIVLLLVFVPPWLFPSPMVTNTGIGASVVNGESIGISDGGYPFDTSNRPGGDAMNEAATAWRSKDVTTAKVKWVAALDADSSNAEAAIYLENQNVLESQQPYITFVVALSMAGGGVANSRDVLQGAYTAQLENNIARVSRTGGPLVRLLIASSGSDFLNATSIARQIVRAAAYDTTILGVMGWTNSARTLKAQPILSAAHLVMLLQSSASSALSNKPRPSYFFRIVPVNAVQSELSAKYVKNVLHYQNVLTFVDRNDPYSSDAGNAFEQAFQRDGGTYVPVEKVVPGASFVVSKATPDVNRLKQLLDAALKQNPQTQLIYLAGNSSDISAFLGLLPTEGPFKDLRVLTGDPGSGVVEVPYNGVASILPPGYNRLLYTAYAYPDAPSSQDFQSAYAANFGKGHEPGKYGYTRADAYAILSYDAMNTLFKGYKIAISQGAKNPTSALLRDALESITAGNGWQGVSGWISFGVNHEPIDKALYLIEVNSENKVHLISMQNCYFPGSCDKSLLS